jgi:DNA-binding MarR family transcriptional regulator
VTDGQLAKYHLTMERLFVLRELATARAPLNMKALARRLSVTPATMSDLVGRLIRDGHVLHCADAFDRRIKVVKPTVNGLYVALVASSLVAAATNRLMAALSSNDKKALVRALQRMKAPEPSSQAPTSTAST